jgi:cobalt-zinc-cadmium efflux system membrane fusion protein
MKPSSHVTVSWTVLVAGALALLTVGGGITYMRLRPTHQASSAPMSSPRSGTSSTPMTTEVLQDVVVPLSKEGAKRAGIRTATIMAGTAPDGLRAPGVVEANAYKVVAVTPVTSGRITEVTAALGQSVQPGQTIARIFSPELADAQTRYITARAELDAHERELARSEKLAQIGSASRQELERLHAGHTARRADVQGAASRLRLLGLSGSAIETLDPSRPTDATISVPAPIAGVVTERLANVGLNVGPSTKLFTVVDLSSVWVVADVYEKDFARIQVGLAARVLTTAYPDRTLQGRVSYIDPAVDMATRTAKVRVEVPNPRRDLRLGMFAEILIGDSGAVGGSVSVPRAAVQNVGDRSVVYLIDPKNEDQFIEREVSLGAPAGDHIAVVSGVQSGDVVVSEGSFYVRAERERLGLRR